MSDFLMFQILLNVSDTLNIKQNISNPNRSIKIIVLIHLIISICIPSLCGSEGHLWDKVQGITLSALLKQRIQGFGPHQVYILGWIYLSYF